mgnify:CR=1 FL=1
MFKIRSHGAQSYIIFVSYFFIRLNGRKRKILQIQPFVLDLSVAPGYGLKEQEGNLRMRATKYRIIVIAAAAVVMAGAAAVILVPRWKKGQDNPKEHNPAGEDGSDRFRQRHRYDRKRFCQDSQCRGIGCRDPAD